MSSAVGSALRLVAAGVMGVGVIVVASGVARGVVDIWTTFGKRKAPPAPPAKAGPLSPGGSVYRTSEGHVTLGPSGWIEVPAVPGWEFTARPLASSEGGGVDYARGTAEDAERWAEKFSGELPSPAELDAYAAHVVERWGASHRLSPVLLVQSADDARGMASRAFAARHDERVRSQLAERAIPTGDPAINIGKHWANDPDAPAGRATNHGWWREGKRPIQDAGHAHNGAHVDYSQTVVLKRRKAVS